MTSPLHLRVVLYDFGGVLGQLLDTFFWALTISWSQLLALCVKWPLVFDLGGIGISYKDPNLV